jgi:hypothetical protein
MGAGTASFPMEEVTAVEFLNSDETQEKPSR